MTSLRKPTSGSDSQRRRPNAEVARLRGQVWLSHAIFLSELSPQEFARRYFYNGRTRSGLLNKWIWGIVSPSGHAVRRVTGLAAAARRTFEHPIFELLKNEPMSAARVWRLLSRLQLDGAFSIRGMHVRVNELRGLCELHPKACRRSARPFRSPVWLPPDSWQLKCRPSLDSLAKMIGLMRAAEDLQYENRHYCWSQDVFRLLPAALQPEWLAPYLTHFADLVEVVRRRVDEPLGHSFEVDLGLLKAQLKQPGFRPLYRERERGVDPIRLEVQSRNRQAPPCGELFELHHLDLY